MGIVAGHLEEIGNAVIALDPDVVPDPEDFEDFEHEVEEDLDTIEHDIEEDGYGNYEEA